jgi:hypothetical protein
MAKYDETYGAAIRKTWFCHKLELHRSVMIKPDDTVCQQPVVILLQMSENLLVSIQRRLLDKRSLQ